MALAVIDSDGSVRCSTGSSDEDVKALTAIGISFNDQTASTIKDIPIGPDFGDCATWAAITHGTSTKCKPAIIPPFLVGAIGIFIAHLPANINSDIARCAIGGTIMIQEPGSEILVG